MPVIGESVVKQERIRKARIVRGHINGHVVVRRPTMRDSLVRAPAVGAIHIPAIPVDAEFVQSTKTQVLVQRSGGVVRV